MIEPVVLIGFYRVMLMMLLLQTIQLLMSFPDVSVLDKFVAFISTEEVAKGLDVVDLSSTGVLNDGFKFVDIITKWVWFKFEWSC